MTAASEPYYVDYGNGRFTATVHTQGAWNPHEQHMGPVSGILAHCLENFQPRDDLRMARISYDILGLIPDGEFEVVTTMLRPGRTIELVQAELVSGGRTAVRATAWRLQLSDTSAIEGIE
ncbi:MAG TPA: thioesterase family protein, partial [Terrimesophilobacter sp.]|nr:thioesterase family protein [Terrimesophilobacter sp.]